jgi:alpha-L-arabinofuranosidase
VVSSPTYTVETGRSATDVSATATPDGREIALNVLNRSRDKDITARVDNQEGVLGRQASVWEMNHPDLKATHTIGDDRKVRPVTRDVTLALEGGGFVYTFPAHSLTVLRLRLE